LPNELKPHHVSDATASRIDDNITSAHFIAPHGTVRKLGGSGRDALFSTFEYQPDQYSASAQLLLRSSSSTSTRGPGFNPSPFLYTTARPVVINALAGHVPAPDSDPWQAAVDPALRAAYMDHQGLLHGPFLPTGGASKSIATEKSSRVSLPTIVSSLLKEIDRDWSDAAFQIYVDEEETIMIQFTLSTVEDVRQLQTYMNMSVDYAHRRSEQFHCDAA
jgi:hypothetical protein